MGIRGVLVFLLAIFMVRYGDRRIFGKSSALDIVLGVILGSILSRAITGNSPFFQTIFTTSLLVFLHWLLAFISYHFHGFGQYVKGDEIALIKEGKMVDSSLAKNNITFKDICEACRKNSIEDPEQVKDAFLERSGEITVFAFDKKS